MLKTCVMCAVLVVAPVAAGAQSADALLLASETPPPLTLKPGSWLASADHGDPGWTAPVRPRLATLESDAGRTSGGWSLSLAQAGQQGSVLAEADRKGFVVGFGGGGALHKSNFSTFSATDFAVLTDFRIGYAPTNHVLLHYSNRVAWTRSEIYDFVGVTGFGTTYMIRPTAPSPFVNGAIGFAFGSDLLDTANPDRGAGFSFGGGYELRRRVLVDGTVMFVRLGPGRSQTVVGGAIHWVYY